MVTWDSITSKLLLIFISYQGIILLIDPSLRNRLYSTIAEGSNVAMPLAESIAEHGRLIVSMLLIPTFFYPKTWALPRFFSLIAYVFYICIIYNIYLFHSISNIGQFLFHLFVLTKVIFVVVDDLTESEINERRLKKQQSKKDVQVKQEQKIPERMKKVEQKNQEEKTEAPVQKIKQSQIQQNKTAKNKNKKK